MADLKMEGLVDYLAKLLGKQFASDVSQIYFGDVGIYPPKAFQNSRGEPKTVIALVPAYDHADPKSISGHSEIRKLGVDVAVLVNMTPYFKAMPEEAFGERLLVRVTERIRAFLAQAENETLQRQVRFVRVGDINWRWMQRGKDASVRAAAIELEVVTEQRRNAP